MKTCLMIGALGLLLVAGNSNVQAQTAKILFPPGQNIKNTNEKLPDVDGSQYLLDDWELGNIKLTNGTSIDSIYLKLNIYKGELHFRYNKGDYIIGSPENIKEVNMNGQKFIFASNIDDKKVKRNYLEVLVDGNIELLVLHTTKRISSNYNVAMDVGAKNDRLESDEKIYIKVGDSIIEHDKKGKKLMAALGNKSEQIKKEIENEDLSFKKKEDMIKIVNFINSVN